MIVGSRYSEAYVLVVVVVLFAAFPAQAQSVSAPANALPGQRAERHGYSLQQCLALAERNHPNILAAQARLEGMRSQLDEAHFAPFSNFTLTAGAGPAPTFRGGPVYTQDREVGLSSNLGMAWRVNVDGTVPVWTFGKVTNLWRAAEAQINVGEADVRKQQSSVRMDVRKAYYGLQLARESLALVQDAMQKIDQALGPLQHHVDEGNADEIDLFRLQTARAELEGKLAEAQKYERVATAALRFLTGIDAGFDISSGSLQPPKHPLAPLSAYLDATRMYRPDIQMARAGVLARQAQSDLARSKMLPDFGIALFMNYARAPEVTDQLNPFVRDDLNYFRYGFGLGLTWSLDFAPKAARIRQADSQLEENRQLYRYALGGAAVEVETAHAQALEAKKKFDAYQQASKIARRWLIKVMQGIDVGTSEERDLVEPARQYALQRFNYLSATFDLNMAMANLALATGWDDLAETEGS